MAELKTKQNEASVENFLNAVENEKKRKDLFTILKMIQEITGKEAKMWGSSIIGFGDIHYKYASGREGDWFLTGFSPRRQSISIYLISGFNQFRTELAKHGKHKTSVSCLYINKLDDVDEAVLRSLIQKSVDQIKEQGFGC